MQRFADLLAAAQGAHDTSVSVLAVLPLPLCVLNAYTAC